MRVETNKPARKKKAQRRKTVDNPIFVLKVKLGLELLPLMVLGPDQRRSSSAKTPAVPACLSEIVI